MTEKRFREIMRNCPGAWLGCGPDITTSYAGHITVDVARVIPAVRYLRKKRVKIAETSLPLGLEDAVKFVFSK